MFIDLILAETEKARISAQNLRKCHAAAESAYTAESVVVGSCIPFISLGRTVNALICFAVCHIVRIFIYSFLNISRSLNCTAKAVVCKGVEIVPSCLAGKGRYTHKRIKCIAEHFAVDLLTALRKS